MQILERVACEPTDAAEVGLLLTSGLLLAGVPGGAPWACGGCNQPLISYKDLGWSTPPFEGVLLGCTCGQWSRLRSRSSLRKPSDVGRPLYRYFRTSADRDLFLRGECRITTLGACRQHSDSARLDSDEGILRYQQSAISGDASDPRVGEVSRRLGIALPLTGAPVSLARNGLEMDAPNIWTLSTSSRFSGELARKWGAYCVRIEQPVNLLKRIAIALQTERILVRAGYRNIVYSRRDYLDLEPMPLTGVFIKDSSYSPEHEVRFIWEAGQDGPPPETRIVSIGQAASLMMPIDACPGGGSSALTSGERRVIAAMERRVRRSRQRTR